MCLKGLTLNGSSAYQKRSGLNWEEDIVPVDALKPLSQHYFMMRDGKGRERERDGQKEEEKRGALSPSPPPAGPSRQS